MGGLFSTNALESKANVLNNEVPSMQMDGNYKLVTEHYTVTDGFGEHRNTAIVIVGNFMRENDISGNPQVFTDAELFNILTKKTTLIALLVINNIQSKTSMQLDGNYNEIIDKYSKTFGFKNNRNTAIVIVGNFMLEHKIDTNPQSFSDYKLYNILTSNTINSAIKQVNTPEEYFENKPVYNETWEL